MQKKALVVSGAVLVLFGLGLAAWVKTTPPQDSDDKEGTPLEVSLNSVGSQAASYAASGETDKALAYYGEQIDRTSDNREKKSLLVQKSLMAIDVGQFDVAIASAKQADAMGSDGQTMRVLADAYAASGNKTEALTYYRKVLALQKPAQESDEAKPGLQSGPSVENIIKELEQ